MPGPLQRIPPSLYIIFDQEDFHTRCCLTESLLLPDIRVGCAVGLRELYKSVMILGISLAEANCRIAGPTTAESFGFVASAVSSRTLPRYGVDPDLAPVLAAAHIEGIAQAAAFAFEFFFPDLPGVRLLCDMACLSNADSSLLHKVVCRAQTVNCADEKADEQSE
jgi:hypothetical protein